MCKQDSCGTSIFEQTYRNYLDEIKNRDLEMIASRLGVSLVNGAVPVTLFGLEFHVSPEGIAFPADHTLTHGETIVLCKYVLLYPDERFYDDSWVTYRDFRDAAPFVGGFQTNVEQPMAKAFTGKLDALNEACRTLGGRTPESPLSYDIVKQFKALPDLPVLLLFNDADDEFPADASVLFERRAEKYLDMECLAGVGWLLYEYLARAAGIDVSMTMGQ